MEMAAERRAAKGRLLARSAELKVMEGDRWWNLERIRVIGILLYDQ